MTAVNCVWLTTHCCRLSIQPLSLKQCNQHVWTKLAVCVSVSQCVDLQRSFPCMSTAIANEFIKLNNRVPCCYSRSNEAPARTAPQPAHKPICAPISVLVGNRIRCERIETGARPIRGHPPTVMRGQARHRTTCGGSGPVRPS